MKFRASHTISDTELQWVNSQIGHFSSGLSKKRAIDKRHTSLFTGDLKMLASSAREFSGV